MSTMKYYIAIKNNTVLNRKPRNEATCYMAAIFVKEARIYNGERKASSKKQCQGNWTAFDMLKSQTGLFSHIMCKINSNELKTEI